ncbi:uncharacterized protein BO72DRAFT_457416 [Aspergillus fijiensis CBS 313.89]|uniref:Secreted protein n=1 Tax=Aspergillus fijiensis CBS 313.89 TaxID=1448319 RepID=A0A8G1VZY7_9EURO|nr:uncharacterized protein BO72DRAFT_457416 [Aspergillus fijiensis CBS 313.89]RAK78812.1 hypothetical protein BO72DRAFT_457416 [Aspergillus fijiensis CBS 313.89]
MRLITFLPTLAAFYLAHGLEAPLPGYGVEEFSWEMETSPGGPTVILSGTVQEIYAELIKINPTYDGDFAELAANNTLAAENHVDTSSSSSLHKRNDVTCNNYPQAIRRRIEEGISYLRGVSGQPRNGPGPGNCGRVSCSYNSAIWWCNDNTAPKTLPSFNNIADGAQVVINQCDPTGVYVSGEENHADKWRALVRSNAC